MSLSALINLAFQLHSGVDKWRQGTAYPCTVLHGPLAQSCTAYSCTVLHSLLLHSLAWQTLAQSCMAYPCTVLHDLPLHSLAWPTHA